MSRNSGSHSPNILYDPLPLDQNASRTSVYRPSISRLSTSDNPGLWRGGDSEGGTVPPRSLGHALYNDGGMNTRDSFTTQGGLSDKNSSVLALDAERTPLDRSRYSGSYYDEPGDPRHSSASVGNEGRPARYMNEKQGAHEIPPKRSKRKCVIMSALGTIVLIVLAVVVPLYLAVIKPKAQQNSAANAAHAANPSSSNKAATASVVTGGQGSTITTENGTTFKYANSFGGYWYWDPNDPFNSGARAQSWTPALNETFNYGVDRIRGTPALFEKCLNTTPQAVDEWTLSECMAADTANGGLQQLENHYATFITEMDFAEIASAGLNFVRIPLPYWAIETWANEPFLAKTAWKYFLKAIQWARKYGIRIKLDFHALPGSQNGWNHSGKMGSVNILNGPMGLANAQRSLDYIRIIAEFISQPEYRDVVTVFGITNEPQGTMVGQDALSRYYMEAYDIVRRAGGTGQGNGPYVSFHDGFLGLSQWAGFLPNSDRTSLDMHPYLCFQQQSSSPMSSYAQTPCDAWGAEFNTSMGAFGLTVAGEWSNAVTDCGLYVNGVGLGTRYEGTYTPGSWPVVGSCKEWNDWQNWNQSMKSDIQQFALASMDALQNWFFWTWKIGPSSVTGVVESPQWSYQLGLQNGWMPQDPTAASGVCQNQNTWTPPLQSWQTGGTGADQIATNVRASYTWPPPTITNGGAASLLPTYTATGSIATLPPPTFTITTHGATSTADTGNGWYNASDTAGAMVAIPTCHYLDPWIGDGSPPDPLCGGNSTSGMKQRHFIKHQPTITQPPSP